MKRTDPPFMATWVLEHLTLGDRNDALSGDLLEEFRGGRSASWYWRQVLSAITIASFREMRARSLVVIFAALWTMPASTWWSFALWFAAHSAGSILPWPYSTDLGMAIVVFVSLWAGLAAYALLYSLIVRNVSLEGVGRGFWIGPLVFTLLTVAIQLLSHPLGIPIASRGALKLVTYSLSLLAAAWRVKARIVPESEAVVS